MRPGVLPMTPKQRSSECVGGTSPRLKKLKFQRSCIKTMLIIFFNSQGVGHKEFVPEGNTVNAEFYKGVMDRLLKRVWGVHPAAFCYRDFFLLHVNVMHKAASVFQVLTPKNVQPFITPHTLQIYLCQTIFCFPSCK